MTQDLDRDLHRQKWGDESDAPNVQTVQKSLALSNVNVMFSRWILINTDWACNLSLEARLAPTRQNFQLASGQARCVLRIP